MEFHVSKFAANPNLSILSTSRIKKDDWLKLAEYYEVPCSSNLTKAKIKQIVITYLVSSGILSEAAYSLCPEVKSDELIKLEYLKLENQREQREHEAKLAQEQKELRLKEMEHEKLMCDKRSDQSDNTSTQNKPLNLGKAIDFVPKFEESEPEEFFQLFERTANQLNWPNDQWIFLAQTALVGRAKEVYSSLSDDNLTYDHFKKTILDIYDVIPDTHRLKFRHTNRGDKQTYLEFAQQLDRSFMNWLRSIRLVNYVN